MTTPAAATHGPAGSRRPRVALGLTTAAAVLVTGALVTRDGGSAPTASDLTRIERSTLEGCAAPGRDTAAETGFALDGVVREVLTAPEDRSAHLDLEVQEWFRGPPLDRVEVSVPAETVRSLRSRDSVVLRPGTRLLVSGDDWGGGRVSLPAAGCGRTLPHDTTTASQWREALGPPGPPSPDGPLARYPSVGWTRGGPVDPPALTGVLLLDRGCVYVDDGLSRWVPVLPGDARWVPDPPQLVWAGLRAETGHQVRLPGQPATGVAQPVGRPVRAEESAARHVDPAGVPAGCHGVRPRFVVSEPLLGAAPPASRLAGDSPVALAVSDGATAAGLGPATVTGETRMDLFGAQQVRLELRTRRLGLVLVHVENVTVLAWPRAYGPSDARFRWSLDPAHADALPDPPPGAQLVGVDRADGTTQLLLRTGGRVVVSVTADPPGTGPADADQVRAMTSLATAVALSRAGVGS